MATTMPSNDLRPKQIIRQRLARFRHAHTLLNAIGTAKNQIESSTLQSPTLESSTPFQLASRLHFFGTEKKAHKKSILGDHLLRKGYNRGHKRRLKLKVAEIAKETPSRQAYEHVTSDGQLVLQAKSHEAALRHAIHSTAIFDPPIPRILLFADGSMKGEEEFCGAGVTYKLLLGGNNEWIDDSYGLLDKTSCNGAEMVGIYCALRTAYGEVLQYMRQTADKQGFRMAVPSVVIFTDSLTSLSRIYHYQYDEEQPQNEIIPNRLKEDMFRPLELLLGLGCRVEINWVPGHSGVEGNNRANKLALVATQYAGMVTKSSNKIPDGLICRLSDLIRHGTPLSLKPMQEELLPNSELGKVLDNENRQALIGDFFSILHDNGERIARTTISRLLEGQTAEEVMAYIKPAHASQGRKRKRSDLEPADQDEHNPIAYTKLAQAPQGRKRKRKDLEPADQDEHNSIAKRVKREPRIRSVSRPIITDYHTTGFDPSFWI